MTAAVKLAGFAAGLALVFGGATVAGGAIGPDREGDAAARDDAMAGHGGGEADHPGRDRSSGREQFVAFARLVAGLAPLRQRATRTVHHAVGESGILDPDYLLGALRHHRSGGDLQANAGLQLRRDLAGQDGAGDAPRAGTTDGKTVHTGGRKGRQVGQRGEVGGESESVGAG